PAPASTPRTAAPAPPGAPPPATTSTPYPPSPPGPPAPAHTTPAPTPHSARSRSPAPPAASSSSRCCASVASASRGLIPKNPGSNSAAPARNPPEHVEDRPAAAGSGSDNAPRSHPRSAGNPDTASVPEATSSHSSSGEATPPGSRPP